jgi:hypothetical protein
LNAIRATPLHFLYVMSSKSFAVFQSIISQFVLI